MIEREKKQEAGDCLRASTNRMEEKHITLDLYFENGEYGIYLGDNNGGSGITITGKTPEDVARDIAPYIADYFYENEG